MAATFIKSIPGERCSWEPSAANSWSWRICVMTKLPLLRSFWCWTWIVNHDHTVPCSGGRVNIPQKGSQGHSARRRRGQAEGLGLSDSSTNALSGKDSAERGHTATLPPCCELGSYVSQEGAGCLMATSCRGVITAQNIPGMAHYRGGRGLTTVF